MALITVGVHLCIGEELGVIRIEAILDGLWLSSDEDVKRGGD